LARWLLFELRVNDYQLRGVLKTSNSIQPERAALLEAAGSANELSRRLAVTLRRAVDEDKLRFGVDFDRDNNPQAIIQFPVAQHTYDWFFSARTGYRAQFWAQPEQGNEYNTQLMAGMLKVLCETVSKEIVARKIVPYFIGASREEADKGPIPLSRETIIRSLDPNVGKIWLCERLIQIDGNNPRDILAIENAERYPPKLHVQRWAKAKNPKTGIVGEGLRAPYPDASECWFDLKGGFISPDKVYQLKNPKERAISLYERGWT
jgi:hypothetical protein